MENEKKIPKQVYRITIKDELDERWNEYFDNVKSDAFGGETHLTAEFEDHSQLYGFLNKLRDLNLTLISLQLLNDDK